jgi:hypothetical protein
MLKETEIHERTGLNKLVLSVTANLEDSILYAETDNVFHRSYKTLIGGREE